MATLTNNDYEAADYSTNKGADLQPVTFMHHEESAKIIAAMSPQEWAAAEKKLLRKIDFQLIPWMT